MACASALSTIPNTDQAIQEALDGLAEGLGNTMTDLALIFSSAHHAEALGELSASIRDRGLARHVLGCTGESIAGKDQEVEGGPALSLWAIQLPGVEVKPIRLRFIYDGFEGGEALAQTTGPGRALIVLGDPFTFPTDVWLKAIDEAVPGLPIIGGMASAGGAPGSNALVLDDEVFEDGAVAALLDGAFSLRSVVSQGCRPIGQHMLITKADRNIIQELGRRPAVEVLQGIFDELLPAEQELVRQGLHVGRVINEYQDAFGRGDFLVRNVMGADESGGIAITELVRVGQTVQFHVRDAASADEDLRALLSSSGAKSPVGALLFSCNGRGTRLFPEPHHDIRTIQQTLGPIPVAGFFAMGEMGPVGGQNFLHGFTASIAVFESGPEI